MRPSPTIATGAIAANARIAKCWSTPADAVLSDRQQQILRMVCEGHTVADIASELALSPERVSDEKYKAIRKLRAYFGADLETAASI